MLQFHCLSKILIIPYQHLFNLADIHCMIVYLFHIKNLINSGGQGRCKPNAIKLALIAEVPPVLANFISKGSDLNRFFVLLHQRLEYFKKSYGTTN